MSSSEFGGIKRVAYQHYKGKVIMVVGFSQRTISKPISSTRYEKLKETIVIFRPIDTAEGILSHLPIEEFGKTIIDQGVAKKNFTEYKPKTDEVRSKKT